MEPAIPAQHPVKMMNRTETLFFIIICFYLNERESCVIIISCFLRILERLLDGGFVFSSDL
jgi:hypothetical protein